MNEGALPTCTKFDGYLGPVYCATAIKMTDERGNKKQQPSFRNCIQSFKAGSGPIVIELLKVENSA